MHVARFFVAEFDRFVVAFVRHRLPRFVRLYGAMIPINSTENPYPGRRSRLLKR